ncbi:MAG: toll/interleukin-1 receptor domain-containing protein [Anaerolineales bacterium]|nr:toll/interleukin-1 receptor domain-containing protein [Anaerolineales bacterium]
MEHIFISYTQEDSKFAHMLADEFARWGITACIDERLDKLRNWPPSIPESIKACPIFIVIMSSEARKSSWVQKEVEYAKSIRKPAFPILLRGESWGSFTSSQILDIRNGQLPDRSFYLKIQETLNKLRHPITPPSTPSKTKAPLQNSSERHAFPYQNIVETLISLAAKRQGRWKLGEYIIEVSSVTLTLRLADDQVWLSGGQAVHPNDKAKVLGQSQPVTVSYEQSNSQHRAGYKMTVYGASKYMDVAIEMIKLYKASGLNPNDLLAEPTRLP